MCHFSWSEQPESCSISCLCRKTGQMKGATDVCITKSLTVFILSCYYPGLCYYHCTAGLNIEDCCDFWWVFKGGVRVLKQGHSLDWGHTAKEDKQHLFLPLFHSPTPLPLFLSRLSCPWEACPLNIQSPPNPFPLLHTHAHIPRPPGTLADTVPISAAESLADNLSRLFSV